MTYQAVTSSTILSNQFTDWEKYRQIIQASFTLIWWRYSPSFYQRFLCRMPFKQLLIVFVLELPIGELPSTSDKSPHVNFILSPISYIPISYWEVVPHASSARYPAVHLDLRLTYKDHVHVKRLELNLRLHRAFVSCFAVQNLFLSNKHLLYVAMLHPV